ncbi:MAG: hypothetical protein JRI68_00170 [Deltaproteobacteria bacterium]|nr:hypothetical protein [Deltaproteobacteria bacterium]
MTHRPLTSGTPLAAVFATALLGVGVAAGACGADVTQGGTGGETTTSSTSSSSGHVDPDCYEECIANGGTQADCEVRCWEDDGTGGSSSSGTSSGTGGGGTGGTGGLDHQAERDCYECMTEAQSDACSTEWEECDADLACSMLLICPYECYGDPTCIDQCHEIIPTGVELITTLVQCMVCGDGPCAVDCENTTWQQYCD